MSQFIGSAQLKMAQLSWLADLSQAVATLPQVQCTMALKQELHHVFI
jgi:hypothetical protein